MADTPDSPLTGLLGLARKAGAVTLGTRATLRGLAQHTLALVLLASDASPRTAREVRRASGAAQVVVMGSMDALGEALGSAPIAVAGVHRGSFAARIARMMGQR